MRFLRVSFLVLSAALMCVAVSPNARADAQNEKSLVTFNNPVQIPGQVLEPGTYMFKLVDTGTIGDNVVRVWNENGTHLYATVLAISDYQMMPKADPIFTLQREGKNKPLRLDSWFYAGHTSGHGFVFTYPHAAMAE